MDSGERGVKPKLLAVYLSWGLVLFTNNKEAKTAGSYYSFNQAVSKKSGTI